MKDLQGAGETREYRGSATQIEKAVDDALAAEEMKVLDRSPGIVIAELEGDLGLLLPITMKAPVRAAIYIQDLGAERVQVEIVVRAGSDYGGGILNPRAHMSKGEVRSNLFLRLDALLLSH